MSDVRAQLHHAFTALVVDELDAGISEDKLELIYAAHPGIMARFETVDRVYSNLGALGQVGSTPAQRGAGHTALKSLHMVELSPYVVDIKLAMGLPLMVKLSPHGAKHAD